MPKILVLICTYERAEFLKSTLQSLNNQTIKNFAVEIIDNGSKEPLDIDQSKYEFPLNIRRNSQNNGLDIDGMNQIVTESHYNYMLWLGDDDCLSEDFFEVCSRIIDVYTPDITSTGLHFYDYARGSIINSLIGQRTYSGKIVFYDGFNAFMSHVTYWGISERKDAYYAPQPAHPSTMLFSKSVIERTLKKQPGLFLQPLGDPGTLGCYLVGDVFIHLDFPMILAGRHKSNASNNIMNGSRSYWIDKAKYIKESPLKGVSFFNLAMDTMLQLIKMHGLSHYIDSRISPKFFNSHVQEIAHDTPWTEQSQRDLEETVNAWIDFLIFSGQHPSKLRKDLRSSIENNLHHKIEEIRNAPTFHRSEEGDVMASGFYNIVEATRYMTNEIRPSVLS